MEAEQVVACSVRDDLRADLGAEDEQLVFAMQALHRCGENSRRIDLKEAGLLHDRIDRLLVGYRVADPEQRYVTDRQNGHGGALHCSANVS
ncbi:hypothetical protein [Sphingomonas sp. CCH5-D11]|uniref:hypothetical protein n=1 Tax=Sphingomonas sp. CCH5-D11 TaxID=1768786 RepID=UPI0012E3A7BB|nr:hypothetical protein [Sphingomonas sp. CCH5-D11]